MIMHQQLVVVRRGRILLPLVYQLGYTRRGRILLPLVYQLGYTLPLLGFFRSPLLRLVLDHDGFIVVAFDRFDFFGDNIGYFLRWW